MTSENQSTVPVTTVAVKVGSVPRRQIAGGVATTGAVGVGVTVTMMLAEVLHPLASLTVTSYVVVVDGLTTGLERTSLPPLNGVPPIDQA